MSTQKSRMDLAAEYAVSLIHNHKMPRVKAMQMAHERFLAKNANPDDPCSDFNVNAAYKALHGKTLSISELAEMPRSERIRIIASAKCIGLANHLTAKIKEA